MLSTQEFEEWCRRLKLPEVTRKVISQIRSTEPVRQVKSLGGNVSGNYCSQKMGKTLQFESHKVELPGIEEYETCEDVLEFYDQPYRLNLKFLTKKGREVTVTHIPDFFVIRQQSAGFEEWKPQGKLEKLSLLQPNRYVKNQDGQWSSPPAEEQAQLYGCYYRIRSDAEIDWIKYRNRQFLRSYTEQKYQIGTEIVTFIESLVSSQPGITYLKLLQYQNVSPDYINALLATEELYIDLSAAPLAEPEKVHIFRNREMALAYNLTSVSQNLTVANSLQIIDVAVGTSFCWDGQPLTVLHNGESKIVLRSSNSLIHLTHSEFDLLVQRGETVGLKVPKQIGIHPEAIERFLKASPQALAEANKRYRVIEPYLHGQKRENETVPLRTIRNWKAKYKAAEQKYCWGYIGLIDNHAAKGNRLPKISPEVWEFIDKIIESHYETLKQRGKLAVYGVLSQEWEKAGRIEHLPSYVTFSSRIKQRSGYQQTKRRLGSRAAYQKSNFYWELEFTTPRHGDRPFEICHIDHTQLDIELVCSRTGRTLGRPWATLLIDATSRRILAIYLTFDEPSYRSCMMVLRICVQRFSRFPETIVVDGGAEFGSTYFETLLAAFGCTKKQRPAAKARFGSVIERIFGTTNTEFFYNLRGNTQITKNVRVVTKSNNPKGQAVWTLDELYEHFCAYSYELYDCKEHPALLQSPRQAFLAGLALSGSRPHKKILYDQNFKIFTLPSTPKGTAKVQPSRGVKINYLYYWSVDDSFINPEVEGINVPVRYDPFDMGTAYAYVKGQWVRCISDYYKSFHNCSEREVKLVSLELHRSRQKVSQVITISAKEKAAYLESAEAKEVLLLQRLHDLARLDVHSMIEGERSGHNHPQNIALNQKNPEPDTNFNLTKDESVILEHLNTIEPYKNEELWR